MDAVIAGVSRMAVPEVSDPVVNRDPVTGNGRSATRMASRANHVPRSSASCRARTIAPATVDGVGTRTVRARLTAGRATWESPTASRVAVTTAMLSLVNGIMLREKEVLGLGHGGDGGGVRSYAFTFPALAVLRRKFPGTERPYRVPGGLVGVRIVAAVTTVLVMFTVVVLVWPGFGSAGSAPAATRPTRCRAASPAGGSATRSTSSSRWP